ncbi:ankyrin repeat and SOCS box protein 18-like [Alosa sapidissima]|uniref:ankyrin repeat and SOCS box protein 18-like n=1 Tax=Alosa sapidissima TaxID=34773 RepID=UPI001C0A2920|nr:ankyrin repeat and SOCS box protein 18-like [Alosa sapidissima]
MFSVSRGSCMLSQSTSYHQGPDGAGPGYRVTNGHRMATREACRGKVPGRDFLCPPVLEELLQRCWTGLQHGLPAREELNQTLEFQSDELRWTAQKRGLWSLEYRRELTSPLCVAAATGYSDCLRFLLEHGARPNLLTGGRTALHEACVNNATECATLLLEHAADPNQLTEEGLAPLHLCTHAESLRCAKLLVRHGAKVNVLSEDEETPLHVAARRGLPQHVQLYLRYGGQVRQRSARGETALGAACGAERFHSGDEEEDRYVQVCSLLLDYGADVNQVDEDRRGPLHKAARNAQHRLVELLLERGAQVNALDYNGCSPLSNALQNAMVRQRCRPHTVVQMLLNHGSINVWPGALLKVLVCCALAPKTVEIVFNSYDMMPVTYKWLAAIPEEAHQMHPTFYGSLFALENTARSLQHYCRSVLRRHCEGHCHRIFPQLPIPKTLKNYLLLEPQGFVY